MKAFSKLFPKRGTAQPPKARIQILSDLHLEVGQQYSSYTFPASAPLLLLGGDVGRLIDYESYLEFLDAQAPRFQKIFLVLGNHEFYGMDHDAGLERARKLTEEPSLGGKVVLLQRTRWDDPASPLTILGCTLWSAIPEDAYSVVTSKVNDFKKIYQWTVQKHNEIHVEDAAWLRGQVQLISSQNVNTQRLLLVATHHAPRLQGTSRPEHSTNPWTSAFATDMIDQGGWDGVRTWVFGHTHYTTDFFYNGIRLVANQRGYVLPDNTTQFESRKRTNTDPHGFNAAKFITL